MSWQRKEIIGGCTLYLGNSMEIMPALIPADLVVSDVPYSLTTGGKAKSQKTMSGIFAADNYANNGQLVMATVPFPAMMNALHAGFQFHNLLVWDKVSPTANRWYMKNLEFTLYLWKGRARTINNPSSKQLIRGGVDKETSHPTEKPVYLMEEYILNSSAHGETVLDPFMGSGTTGVACVKTGRKFIGIEIDPIYFELACERIRDAYSLPSMFSDQAHKAHSQGAMDI
ncbi:site-specific DNA-methyltransferase [Agrobacterium rhizogenes]|nr:site-specific DNA-methyltransferase [Rhizobium rhizogenes]